MAIYARNRTQFKLHGADEMTRLLQNYPSMIQRDIVNSVAARGASVIKKNTKKNIRSIGAVRLGNLHNSIETKKKKGRDGSYWIYADSHFAPHAHLVEYGTAPRKLDKPVVINLGGTFVTVTHTGSVGAQPFMRPALTEHVTEVLAAMKKRAKKGMEKHAKKMNQKYGTLSKAYRRKLAT